MQLKKSSEDFGNSSLRFQRFLEQQDPYIHTRTGFLTLCFQNLHIFAGGWVP